MSDSILPEAITGAQLTVKCNILGLSNRLGLILAHGLERGLVRTDLQELQASASGTLLFLDGAAHEVLYKGGQRMTEETTERSLTTYDICPDTVDALARDGE